MTSYRVTFASVPGSKPPEWHIIDSPSGVISGTIQCYYDVIEIRFRKWGIAILQGAKNEATLRGDIFRFLEACVTEDVEEVDPLPRDIRTGKIADQSCDSQEL